MTETLHPELERAGSFEHLPLGRRAVYHDPKTLRLASYLDDDALLPQVPDAVDYTAAVASWPMYGNDRLGDCTFADLGHMIQAWTANAGDPRTPSEADVVAGYWATGSADDGRFEVEVLNYWRNVGVAGDKIGAYAYVDPKNLAHVRAAIYLFGGVYVGVALPETAQQQPVWDVVGDGKTGPSEPDSWGGHAIPLLGYQGDRFRCVTWGAVLDLTEAFHLAYTDEVYAIISPDWLGALDGGKTPAGFDLASLMADLQALTSGVVVSAADDPMPAPAQGDGFTWNG